MTRKLTITKINATYKLTRIFQIRGDLFKTNFIFLRLTSTVLRPKLAKMSIPLLKSVNMLYGLRFV